MHPVSYFNFHCTPLPLAQMETPKPTVEPTATATDEASPAIFVTPEDDEKYGFARADIGKEGLAGTVGAFDRHIFLCYQSADVWPSHIETSDAESLPSLLAAALKARKNDIEKRTRLTICGWEDGSKSSDGDVLIFPDMIRYRGLTHSDVDTFVEEVLVKNNDWLPGAAELLAGSYVFVCAHGSRDKRCGVCGPPLITKFLEEIASHDLQGQVFVSPCSHVGGHKYAGNVIIFSPNLGGEVSGHWYGYVTPDDVPALLEKHIGKHEIVERLWRGQMGLSEEQQKEAQSLRLLLNAKEENAKEFMQSMGTDSFENGTSNVTGGCCCQGVTNSTCCQVEKLENKTPQDKTKKVCNGSSSSSAEGLSARKISAIPKWFERWEREDTYAAFAVVAAVASIAIAYSCYKQTR